MKLENNQITLFEKLHKLYVNYEDTKYFTENHDLKEIDIEQLVKSAGAYRFLADFNTNLDCKSIGFSGKNEMREYFHKWLVLKNWKGSNVTFAVLLRKFSKFRKAKTEFEKLNTLVKKNKGNKNALKFDLKHKNLFQEAFIPNDFEKTFENYLLKCNISKINNSLSKTTLYNYYKKENLKLIKLYNVKNIKHFHAQFVKLSDFDIYHKELNLNKKTSAELMNSAACLEMLNYKNLKFELQKLGFKTKEQFLTELLLWLNKKQWQGLNKISNTRVITRKATIFKKALQLNRIEALKVLIKKNKGSQNALKLNNQHKEIKTIAKRY